MTDQPPRIGVQILPGDPFWVQVREVIESYAEQQRLELIILNADLSIMSGEAQVSWVEELLAQELDVLIAGNVPDYLVRHILGQGLPLISSGETEIHHPRFVCPEGLYAAAETAARFVAEQIGGRGQVLMLGGLIGTGDVGRSRVRGFGDTLAQSAHVRLIHIPTPWDAEGARDHLLASLEATDAQRLPSQIDALFGLSDSLALVGREIGRRRGWVGDDTCIVGINGDPLALSAIADGTMHATVETSPVELGRSLLDMAHQAARRQPLPDRFPFKLRLVTAKNVAEVAAEKLMAIAGMPSRLVNVNRRQEQMRLMLLETSLEINRRIGKAVDWQNLARELAELIRLRVGYDHAQLFLWDAEAQALVLDQPGVVDDARIRVPADGATVLGHVLLSNQPLIVPHIHRSQRFAPDPHWPRTLSRVVLPIRLGGRLTGILDLHSQTVTHHAFEFLEGLQMLADQLGVALQNAQLHAAAHAARRRADATQVGPQAPASAGDLPQSLPAAAEPVTELLEPILVEMVGQSGELVNRTAGYIRSHYHRSLVRQEIADAVGVSPSYVTRVFRREVGISPWQFLTRYRVAKAQRLLSSTKLSMTEIAGLVGFNDSAYFSRIFRQETGQTPRQYRNAFL